MDKSKKDDEMAFEDIDDIFKRYEEEQKEEDKKHPFRAHIRDWLDERFPSGIADYRASYALTRPWKILRYWKNEVRFAWQRVLRGWDDKATWHVGYYLAETLPGIIRQLKEEGDGVPIRMYEGEEGLPFSEKQLGSIDKNGNYVETEEDKKALEKWNKILDEIADGFDAYIKFDESTHWGKSPEEDENYVKFQRALDLLKEYYEDLWD